MPQAMPLDTLITQSSQGGRKYRTIVVQFGDGYSQRAPDGINSKLESWNLVWQNVTTAERATILAAFDAVGGWDHLTWTPPGGSSTKWRIVEGYTEVAKSGDHWDISVNVEQVFV